MRSVWIILICTLTATLYGIVHNQISVSIYPEFMEVFMFQSALGYQASPQALAFDLGWRTTWWVGAILGVALVLMERIGPAPRLSLRELGAGMGAVVLLTAVTTGTMASRAATEGLPYGHPDPIWVVPEDLASYRTVATMHTVSYFAGFGYGLLLVLAVLLHQLVSWWRDREKIETPPSARSDIGFLVPAISVAYLLSLASMSLQLPLFYLIVMLAVTVALDLPRRSGRGLAALTSLGILLWMLPVVLRMIPDASSLRPILKELPFWLFLTLPAVGPLLVAVGLGAWMGRKAPERRAWLWFALVFGVLGGAERLSIYLVTVPIQVLLLLLEGCFRQAVPIVLACWSARRAQEAGSAS